MSVDPYAAHLALVQQHTLLDSPDTATAFADQPTDDGILEELSGCRFLLLGWRGHWQLNPDQQAWVAAHHRPLPHTGPVDLSGTGRRLTRFIVRPAGSVVDAAPERPAQETARSGQPGMRDGHRPSILVG